MGTEQSNEGKPATTAVLQKRHRLRRRLSLGIGIVVLYLLFAYVVMPQYWIHYARRHPSFDDVPGITMTGNKTPGDPLNVALVGTATELKKIMLAAHWYPADPLTLRSCREIAEASVLKRPYDDAPVSNLYLFGRKQDLAFERPVGNSPRHRHHVRFWRTDKLSEDRPVWVGSAIYDDRVGISRRTGQVTHHTAADIDAERDLLFQDLQATGELAEVYFENDFHKIRKGKNGGGDPWYTDGRLEVGIIRGH
jgi:LssY C-terminus